MHELTSTKRKWPLFQSMAFVSLGYCPKIKEIQNKFKKRKKRRSMETKVSQMTVNWLPLPIQRNRYNIFLTLQF